MLIAKREVFLKYKRIILAVLIVIALLVIKFLPEEGAFLEIAAVGSPAPDFELKDLNGNLWKLSDLKGKVVFISFWASWCPSCHTETPTKESLLRKLEGKPFQMLGILYRDNPSDAMEYVAKNGVTVPTLLSPDNEVARLYGITGVPEAFIIDKNGIVREKIVGPRDWDTPESIALIEKWL
ncbi:MAG: TlpA family protein disulfide reductase [Nitrospirae bacterium]|nr:TlpA family protein disulfide reductase [Nitrospirota bacterium]